MVNDPHAAVDRVHREIGRLMDELTAVEKRYQQISELREHARTVLGELLASARPVLDEAGAAPDRDLARELYWHTRVRVSDLGRYVGIPHSEVHAFVGPLKALPCDQCGQPVAGVLSRSGYPKTRCETCQAAWDAAAESRRATWLAKLALEEQNFQAQMKVLHEWLDARDWEVPGSIFEVPGVDGYWTLEPDGEPKRAQVMIGDEFGDGEWL